MNRRQFLTGVSAAAVASALPATPVSPIVGVDLALPGSERTALWIIESTPGSASGYFYELYKHADDLERRIAEIVFAQSDDPFNLSDELRWLPTLPISGLFQMA